MTLFIVEHHVQDKEAWDNFFEGMTESFKGKSVEELKADPSCKGNKCILTSSSVDGQGLFCLWEVPDGSTMKYFQDFIDDLTDGARNEVHQVEGSMGLENLSSETYTKDMVKLVNEGSTSGFSGDGELFFVHHHIPDKEAWDAVFAEKAELVKGKSTADDITEAWQVGDGVKGVMWCGLGDKDAVCMWSMPKGSTESDFQAMIDKFCGHVGKNVGFKIEPSTAIGSRLVHPDFYAQDAIAYANSMSA
jgi:hypothetical protein